MNHNEIIEEINRKALAERDSGYCGGCGIYQQEIRKALTFSYNAGIEKSLEVVSKMIKKNTLANRYRDGETAFDIERDVSSQLKALIKE